MAMQSPTCCCCLPIRSGVLLLGMLELVFVSLSIAQRAYFLAEPDSYRKFWPQGYSVAGPVVMDTSGEIDRGIAIGQLVVNCLQVLMTFSLIYGVLTISPSFLLPHLVVQVVGCFVWAAQAVMTCLLFGLSPFTIGQAAAWALIVLLSFYFTFAVWLCYGYLRLLKMMENAPNGFTPKEPGSEMTSL